LDPNPRQPPCYAPTDPRYWDRDDLDYELQRVFDVCHSCRMCLSYCPAFPELFGRVDAQIAAGRAHGAERLDAEDLKAVVDACFQCKLCYVKCPYTEDEGHPWLLDFPRLALREKANRALRDGVSLQDRMLGEPQLLGALTAGPQAKIANLVSANRLLRKPAEAVAGISAQFPLPAFATETFASWWRAREAPVIDAPLAEVALFTTCYGNFNATGPSLAAVRVLERHRVRVHYPQEQTCCGMPNLDGGDVGRAQEKAKQNVRALLPWVRRGIPVLIPGPTCSYVLTKEYPALLGTEEAREVAAASIDLMKWIDRALRRKKRLEPAGVPLGKIAYHAPCHLRAQKIALPAVQVLEHLGAEVEAVQQCSAVDGTWGMKAQWYELGRRYAQKLVREVREAGEAGATLAVSDCPLASLRIAHETALPVLHPIEVLARAYGLGEESHRQGEPR
jgi:glycerol-3-phosphate dehydrogenase subunit C